MHTNLTMQRVGRGSPNKSTLDAGRRGQAWGAETSVLTPREAKGRPEEPEQVHRSPEAQREDLGNRVSLED